MSSVANRNVLPQELVRELFTYVDGQLFWRKPGRAITVGAIAGYKKFFKTHKKFRWLIEYKGKPYRRSVLVWIYHHGDVPVDRLVDHRKSKETLNDKLENLRLATQEENGKNRAKHRTFKGKPTSSKYKGVSWNKNAKKWEANIGTRKNGKYVKLFLGLFATEKKAYAAYVAAAKKIHGEFFNPG
jgi:hypothetical protein